MKKIFIYILLVVAVLMFALFGFAKLSDSHIVAVNFIKESRIINTSIGAPKILLLVGVSSKSGPSLAGCNNLGYLVIGKNGTKFVRILLAGKGVRGNDWSVIEMSEGYFSNIKKSC